MRPVREGETQGRGRQRDKEREREAPRAPRGGRAAAAAAVQSRTTLTHSADVLDPCLYLYLCITVSCCVTPSVRVVLRVCVFDRCACVLQSTVCAQPERRKEAGAGAAYNEIEIRVRPVFRSSRRTVFAILSFEL